MLLCTIADISQCRFDSVSDNAVSSVDHLPGISYCVSDEIPQHMTSSLPPVGTAPKPDDGARQAEAVSLAISAGEDDKISVTPVPHRADAYTATDTGATSDLRDSRTASGSNADGLQSEGNVQLASSLEAGLCAQTHNHSSAAEGASAQLDPTKGKVATGRKAAKAKAKAKGKASAKSKPKPAGSSLTAGALKRNEELQAAIEAERSAPRKGGHRGFTSRPEHDNSASVLVYKGGKLVRADDSDDSGTDDELATMNMTDVQKEIYFARKAAGIRRAPKADCVVM